MSSESAVLRFEIYRGGSRVWAEEFSEATIKIGRLPSSHVRLDDASVARIHAVVERSSDGEVYVIDLGSSGGTWVGGKRVSKHRLCPGEEVVVGETRITISRVDAQGDVASLQGWYDEAGSWHDGVGGYYDVAGNYHSPHGGWYDAEGNHFDGEGGYYDVEGEYHACVEVEEVVRDAELLSARYMEEYDSSGSGVLEVAFLWNDHITAVNAYRSAETVTIGEDAGNTLLLRDPSIPVGQFALLEPLASGQVAVNFTTQMGGFFYVGETRYTLAEAVESGLATPGRYGAGSYSVVMSPRTRARLELGAHTVLVHYASAPARVAAGRVTLSADLVGAAAVSFALHAVFMFMAFFLPPNPQSFELNEFSMNDRFITQVTKAAEPEKEEVPEWLEDAPEESAASGERAPGAEGQAGEEDVKTQGRAAAIRGPRDKKPRVKLPNREVAYNTGALQVLGRSPLALAGADKVLEGFDPVTAMGDNKGRDVGDAYGFGALGLTGMGRNAGGVGEARFGAGGPGPGGMDVFSRDPRNRGTRVGGTEGRIIERKLKGPGVHGGAPVVQGTLSRAIIRGVIRRNIRQVRYCYEQEVMKNTSLSGRVVVKFTITATGRVASAAPVSNTVNSAVGACVAGKVRRWVFPQPENGGLVIVSYPFVFSSR